MRQHGLIGATTQTQYEEALAEIQQQRVWEVVPPGQPYGSLEALLEAEIGYGELEARRQLVAQASTKGQRADMAESVMLTQPQRAQQNGIGRDSQRKLDYLAGHAPALLTAVQAGTVSTHAAYQEARGIPKETHLTTLHRIWRVIPFADAHPHASCVSRRMCKGVLRCSMRSFGRNICAYDET